MLEVRPVLGPRFLLRGLTCRKHLLGWMRLRCDAMRRRRRRRFPHAAADRRRDGSVSRRESERASERCAYVRACVAPKSRRRLHSIDAGRASSSLVPTSSLLSFPVLCSNRVRRSVESPSTRLAYSASALLALALIIGVAAN